MTEYMNLDDPGDLIRVSEVRRMARRIEELERIVRDRNSSLKNARLLIDALQARNEEMSDLLIGFVRSHRRYGIVPCPCEFCEEAVRVLQDA